MEPNIVGLKTEKERVNLHRSHAKFPVQFLRHYFGCKTANQVGRQEKSQQRVEYQH